MKDQDYKITQSEEEEKRQLGFGVSPLFIMKDQDYTKSKPLTRIYRRSEEIW